MATIQLTVTKRGSAAVAPVATFFREEDLNNLLAISGGSSFQALGDPAFSYTEVSQTPAEILVLVRATAITTITGTASLDTINELTPAAGVTIDGVLLKDSQVTTDVILEKTANAGVTADGFLMLNGVGVTKATPASINATATATAAQIAGGYIKSTSAAAVAITTPTATAIAALIGAAQGTSLVFMIDNSAGANTVTLTLDASIAVVTPAVTGGATLTVTTANAIGIFRLVFTSGTSAKIFRIG